MVSSPVAESIVDSDFEEENELHDGDHYECEDDSNRKKENGSAGKATGTAVTFMGQLTPSSSAGKMRPRTPECPTWTRYFGRISW